MSPVQDAPRFGRVITAMVTPFDDGGGLVCGVLTFDIGGGVSFAGIPLLAMP